MFSDLSIQMSHSLDLWVKKLFLSSYRKKNAFSPSLQQYFTFSQHTDFSFDCRDGKVWHIVSIFCIVQFAGNKSSLILSSDNSQVLREISKVIYRKYPHRKRKKAAITSECRQYLNIHPFSFSISFSVMIKAFLYSYTDFRKQQCSAMVSIVSTHYLTKKQSVAMPLCTSRKTQLEILNELPLLGDARQRRDLPLLVYCCQLFQSMCHTYSPSQFSTVTPCPLSVKQGQGQNWLLCGT